MSTFTEGLVLGDVVSIGYDQSYASANGLNLYQCPAGRFAEVFLTYFKTTQGSSLGTAVFGTMKSGNSISSAITNNRVRSILLSGSPTIEYSYSAFSGVTQFQSQIILNEGDYLFTNNNYGFSVTVDVSVSATIKEWVKP